jgi:hypothetical protein
MALPNPDVGMRKLTPDLAAVTVSPLSHRERVGVRGYGFSDRPEPLTRFAAQIDLSPWER